MCLCRLGNQDISQRKGKSVQQFFLLFMCCREKAKSHLVHTIVGILYFRFINTVCSDLLDLAFAYVRCVFYTECQISFLLTIADFWLTTKVAVTVRFTICGYHRVHMGIIVQPKLLLKCCHTVMALMNTCPKFYHCPGRITFTSVWV